MNLWLEKYFYLEGAHESLMKLNQVLKKTGYEIMKFTADQFEDKFHDAFVGFGSERDPKESQHWMLEGKESITTMSRTFDLAARGSHEVHYGELYFRGYVMLMKDSNQFEDEEEQEEKEEDEENESEHEETYSKFDTEVAEEDSLAYQSANELIAKLRIFKKGFLSLLSHFYFAEMPYADEPVCFHSSSNVPTIYGDDEKEFRIDDDDIPFLAQHISQKLEVPPLLQLAFDSFNESYYIKNDKLGFVLLMTALESIFNKSGQDPIQHIMSRHVALLLTSNKIQFEELNSEVRNLYNIRSIIVHGKNDSSSLKKISELKIHRDKLEGFVRSVLKKLIWLYDYDQGQPTKESLFNYLNAKGFEG